MDHPVPTPFLVIATQNPIDLEGAYQLPEAQLDRFLMRLSLGYADLDTETEILAGRAQAPAPVLRVVTTLEQVSWLQQVAAELYVAPELTRYDARRGHPGARCAAARRQHPGRPGTDPDRTGVRRRARPPLRGSSGVSCPDLERTPGASGCQRHPQYQEFLSLSPAWRVSVVPGPPRGTCAVAVSGVPVVVDHRCAVGAQPVTYSHRTRRDGEFQDAL